MEQRTRLLKVSDKEGLRQLEQDCLANNANHKDWECTRAKMNLTAGQKALYMHCLPADITDVSCNAGEVSAEVFEQYRIPTYNEASYKPFVISALMFLTRMKDPGAKLESLINRAQNLYL
jgi:ornithine carbamoyltransferase